MSLALTPEEGALVETAENVARRGDFRSLTARADVNHEFAWEIWEKLKAARLPALDIPADEGGEGGACRDVVATYEALAEHSISATTALFTFAGFGAHVLTRLSSDHPLRSLLPGIAAGDVRTALGLTEAAGGSDLSQMTTTLAGADGEWSLHGAKMYATLAAEATHLVVGALVPGESSWRDRFALAFVPCDSTGIDIQRLDVDALRSCPTYHVFIDSTRVASSAVVAPPEAFRVLVSVLNLERLSVAAQSLGLATRALELALEHVYARSVGGALLAEKQSIAHRLADCWESLESARLLVRAAATRVDAGERGGTLPTMAQRLAARVAHEIADTAVQVHGGSGLAAGSEVHRLWRDTRLHLIGPIAREEAADHIFRRMKPGTLRLT